MFCPMKFSTGAMLVKGAEDRETKCQCEQNECAWWNDRFGICALAVSGFVAGEADWRAEREAEKEWKRKHDDY